MIINIFKKSIFALAGVVAVGVGFAGSAEAFSLFSNRSTFESQLDNFIVDNYSNPGYFAGDNFDAASLDSHTDTNMSSIVGETQYTTTGFSNNNLIANQSSGDPLYCAGCNGSFLLDFTSTSVGNDSGVFGVGFDVGRQNVFGTFAFVTFGDGSTDNFLVPERVTAFWGLTSDLLISSIHFGLENGGSNTDNNVQRMALDNLTIGSARTSTEVPEPASTLALLAFGVAAAGTVLKKKQAA